MNFADLDPLQTYSYADYFKWDFENRVELINGTVYELMAGPSRLHQDIVVSLVTGFSNFLRGTSSKVYVAPFDVRLPKKGLDDRSIFTVLQPDVCVVCDPAKLDDRGCVGAPDIVIEVLSPGNNAKEVRKKFDVYEEAGVREYWLISPQNQTALVHILKEAKFLPAFALGPGDIITSTVLPGFTLDLAALFGQSEIG